MPDLNSDLAITLTIQEWNAVLATLAEGRYSVVSPLIQKIAGQAQAQAQAQQEQAQEQAQERSRPHLQPA